MEALTSDNLDRPRLLAIISVLQKFFSIIFRKSNRILKEHISNEPSKHINELYRI